MINKDCPHNFFFNTVDQSLTCVNCASRWVADLRLLEGKGKISTYRNKRLLRDTFGRLYLDMCKNDHEHLMAPTLNGKERRDCRISVESLFPDEILGVEGDWEVHVLLKPRNQ